MKKFLTATQIAKLEDVAAPTVTRWVREGVFAGARRVGREYRIPMESYDQWRESTKIIPVRSNERTNAPVTSNL
jgi:excisionase family DNA binding protein